jgi:TRAP-type transport system periplasmic protein
MTSPFRWILTIGLLWIITVSAVAEDTIRMGVPWSPASKGMNELKAVARSLSRKTEGRLQVKFVEQHDLDGGALPSDGVLLVGPALAEHSSVARIIALPLLFRSLDEVEQVRQTLDGEVAAELETQGLVPLVQLDLGFAYLLSTISMETPAQLKAARLWVPPASAESIRDVESYGVSLVPMHAGKVRDALRQDALDVVVAPPLGAILLQWHPELTQVIDTPLVSLAAVVVLRKEALESLETADQVLLRDELSAVFLSLAEDLRQKESEALEVLALNGVERKPLGSTPEQQAEWMAWATGVADQLAADGFIPAATLAETRKVLAAWRSAP